MADGSLQLPDPLPLPAGPVQVTVAPITELPPDDPFWQRMQAIWAGQRNRGQFARSEQEIETERRVIRDDWEKRSREIEATQAAAEKSRSGD